MSSNAIPEVAQSFQDGSLELSAEPATPMTNSVKVAEFHAYVAQNAEVLGESERSPGFKAPIGLLVRMCPVEITDQNVDTFYAEVQGMVSRAQQEVKISDEAEEVKDKTEPDEEAAATTEIEDKAPGAPTTRAEKEVAKAEPVKNTSSDSSLGAVRAESAVISTAQESGISSGFTRQTVGTKEGETSHYPAQPDNQSPEKVPGLKAEAHKPVEIVKESPEKAAMTATVGNSDIEESRTSSTQIHEPEAPMRLAENKPEDNPMAAPAKEFEVEEKKLPEQTFVKLDSDSRQAETAPGAIEPQPPGPIASAREMIENEALILELEQNNVADFTEPLISADGEEWIRDFGEVATLKDIFHTEAEQPVHSYLHLEAPQPGFELSLPVDEVEHAVQELAERIETLNDGESQAVFNILDKITAKSEEIASGPYDTEDQEQALDIQEDKAEELKELFIELFDQLEVEYTPELLESFAKLALRGHMAEITEAIEADDKNGAMIDRGTHEAITKLLAAVSHIKKAMLHAYNIGRSMLRLCSQQMTATA